MKSCYWRVNTRLSIFSACACERISESPNSSRSPIMTHEVILAGPGGDYCVVVGESILEQPEVNAPRLSLWSSHQPLGFRPEAGLIAIKRTHSEDGMHPYRSRGLQVSKRWLRPPLAPLPGVPWGLHISDGSRSRETISSRSSAGLVPTLPGAVYFHTSLSPFQETSVERLWLSPGISTIWPKLTIRILKAFDSTFPRARWSISLVYVVWLSCRFVVSTRFPFTLICHALKSIGGSKSPGG